MFKPLLLYIVGTIGIAATTIVFALGLCAAAAGAAIAVHAMIN